MNDQVRRQIAHVLGETDHIDPTRIVTCTHCGQKYDWHNSANESLPMTFCSYTCEMLENGTTVEAILHAQRADHD